MALQDRLALIKRIEEIRGSHVICYLTSMRPGVDGRIAYDVVRVFYDHLLLLPARPVERLDLFLCSNGGDSTVPWRLTALFREFARTVGALLPYRCYSASTMLALGADEIVMHPFAELGPIDPTVGNPFNPQDHHGTSLGIAVEDVRAYFEFVRTTAGVDREDDRAHAFQALVDKVHPLALGNVERSISQARQLGRKILGTHMADPTAIEEIVETMLTRFYFHGHPINRREAVHDVHLPVSSEVNPELEETLWTLYREYEGEFANLEPFNPAGDMLTPSPPATERHYALLNTLVESPRLTSSQVTQKRYIVDKEGGLRDMVLSSGWDHGQPRPS